MNRTYKKLNCVTYDSTKKISSGYFLQKTSKSPYYITKRQFCATRTSHCGIGAREHFLCYFLASFESKQTDSFGRRVPPRTLVSILEEDHSKRRRGSPVKFKKSRETSRLLIDGPTVEISRDLIRFVRKHLSPFRDLVVLIILIF